MSLTQKSVDGLATNSDGLRWDDAVRGLGLRVQRGRATWVVRFRVRGAGTQRQVTLGAVSGLKLAKAREMAGEVIAEARRGKDVVAEHRERAGTEQKRRKAKAEKRLGSIVERYIAAMADKLRPRT